MMLLPDTARGRLEVPVLVLVAVAAGGAAGMVSATDAWLGAAVIGSLLLIALTAHRPVVLAVIAMIAVFASQRLGSTALAAGGKPGVTYSDALLAAAAVLSIPALLGTEELRRMRLAGWGIAAYLSFLLPTVLLNSSQRGYLEWLHRLLLLGGSLLVGAWIARENKVRPALRWLTLITCVIAAVAASNAIMHGWTDAVPFGLNKNFAGGLLGAVIVLVFIAREELALPAPCWYAVIGIISAGEIASHSRGGALAASVGLFLAFVLQGRAHRGSARVLAVLVAAGLVVFIYTSVRDQLNHPLTTRVNHSSIAFRFNVERATRDVWRTSPVYGVGLKYYNAHVYGPYGVAADNAVDNELAESGIIGLAGFVILQGAMLSAGFRRGRREPLAAAGFGVVAGLLAHGMVDIYWTAGTVTLPFIIMGIGLAREPSDHIHRPARRGSSVDPPRVEMGT